MLVPMLASDPVKATPLAAVGQATLPAGSTAQYTEPEGEVVAAAGWSAPSAAHTPAGTRAPAALKLRDPAVAQDQQAAGLVPDTA
jgi:hypothetical protein